MKSVSSSSISFELPKNEGNDKDATNGGLLVSWEENNKIDEICKFYFHVTETSLNVYNEKISFGMKVHMHPWLIMHEPE